MDTPVLPKLIGQFLCPNGHLAGDTNGHSDRKYWCLCSAGNSIDWPQIAVLYGGMKLFWASLVWNMVKTLATKTNIQEKMVYISREIDLSCSLFFYAWILKKLYISYGLICTCCKTQS